MSKIKGALLFFLGLFLGCLFYKYCMNSTNDGWDGRVIRVPILDSCKLDDFSFDRVGDWRVINFDLRNDAIHSGSFIELRSDYLPDEVLKSVYKEIGYCFPDVVSKYSSHVLLSSDMSKYYSASNDKVIYLRIEKGVASVVHSGDIE